MKRNYLLTLLLILSTSAFLFAQDRKELNVPMADSGAIKIDGVMDEAAWGSAAEVNLVTSTEYNIFSLYYDRDGVTEPEYDEYYARLLWSRDTLYAFIHIDEVVNDSSGLYWAGQWLGDQLFVSLSSRLGRNMQGWYDGNVYAAPEGPYHYLILGDQVTLNNGAPTYLPDEYLKCSDMSDTVMVFDAADYAKWGITIDKATGVWNIEMAIYNPGISSQSAIGFNIGGSQGSEVNDTATGDAYMYYTWQPSIQNDPFADPYGNGDPGYYNLANSDYWAVLHFMDGMDRKELEVPMADSGAIKIDAVMDETAWTNAAQVNLVTNTEYNIFSLYYDRDGVTEPEYDEYYARLLWSTDTLYAFIHIDEVVNDSTGLYWAGQWLGDQLFVSLSDRLGMDMKGWYDGNVYAAPDGPYHYLILGDQVTLNNDSPTFIPEEYRRCFADSQMVFNASDNARWAVSIDEATGVWNIEMAIYNPGVAAQSRIGFNIGGSQGSEANDTSTGDAYMYYTWQPSIQNDPFADPYGNGDPGFYNLANADYWAALKFVSGIVGVYDKSPDNNAPTSFNLMQNYPNPFNPATTIKFEVAKNSPVTLKIYNVVGQVVATLINSKQMEVGTHSIQWNAGNLASGVYFYELKAENVIQTKKMILLK